MRRGLSLWFGLCIGAAAPAAAQADERIDVCYNYGCNSMARVRYSEAQLGWVRKQLAGARNPGQERAQLSQTLGRLYEWAGRQSPIHADRGGNLADAAVNGAMDCIDHSTTTTRLLAMLERRRMLRYHHVLAPVRRTHAFVFEHYSAAIEELPPRWLPRAKIVVPAQAPAEIRPDRFAVDSWFVNNGRPAVILPLEDWQDGAGPQVEPLNDADRN